MNDFIYQLHTLLTTSPGNLAYHLILAFTMAWCLQYVIIQSSNSAPHIVKRFIVGFSLLLSLQIILALISGAANNVFSKPEDILPPLDRAVTALSLWIILWLWSSPNATLRGNSLFIIGGIITTIFFFTTLIGWSERNSDLFFNASLLSPLWALYTLITCLIAFLLVINRKPIFWQTGSIFFAINLLFNLLALRYPILDSHYLGMVRFGQIITYPLMFSLTLSLTRQKTPETRITQEPISSEPELLEEFIQNWFQVQNQLLQTPLAIIAQFFKTALHAEEVFILTKGENSSEDLILWYPTTPSLNTKEISNFHEELSFSQAACSKKQVPLLSHAISKSKSIIIDSENQSQDLQTLKAYLKDQSPAHLLGVPISNEPSFLALILTRKSIPWRKEDEARAIQLSQWLNKPRTTSDSTSSQPKEDSIVQESYSSIQEEYRRLKELFEEQSQKVSYLPKLEQTVLSLQENLTSTKNQILELQQALSLSQVKNEELEKNLELARKELQHIPEYQDQLNQARGKIEELQKVIEQKNIAIQDWQRKFELEKSSIEKILNQKNLENKKLLQKYDESARQLEVQEKNINLLDKELNKAKRTIDELKKQLAAAEKQTIEIREQLTQQMEQRLAEIAASTQELRYPMSTILDYSDLLLDESVGALGALQKKFLEKVKEGIKQLDERLTQLSKITILESNVMSPYPRMLDMQTALDKCLAVYEMDIQEKGLRVDTKETNIQSPLPLDKDAFHQIMVNLLRHSINMAPPRGNIKIKTVVNEDESSRQLFVQISDDGEVLPKDELSLVFSPFYRPSYLIAARPGESEMGPSIAKTLIEALKGRIWIDSEEGKGNTFSFILPLTTSSDKDETKE